MAVHVPFVFQYHNQDLKEYGKLKHFISNAENNIMINFLHFTIKLRITNYSVYLVFF